jgi:rhomboid protease GluP
VLKRQRTGSVICSSCGVLVGVGDDTCYNCGRRNPGLWGYAPALRSLGQDLGFVPFVIGSCIVIYAATLLVTILNGGNVMGGGFSLLSPDLPAVFLFGASGAAPVVGFGRWWTVLSASWLHAGVLHIALNMFSLRQLAPAIADLFGPGRMVIIYTAGGVAGFTASTLAGTFLPPMPYIGGSTFTLGASASISGLIGAVLAYGHRSGSSQARQYAIQSVIMLVFYGFMFSRIDNWAHLGGFGGGYLAAKFLDPLKPERIDHMVIALGCVAASFIAIIASILHGIQFLQQ